ncbi:phosphatidate cytidylyltransferase [Novimethylophilus kurashikiensis]|uniref:Phosphatidate cytidylyltransferase n=1 Tax=Novimethylophilus kurashikiensis TaxID=1825523 RepID=A0A2R5F7Y2_9PROT|nr:phosphatidate cytidylyltransferase [Novimethylophilus kurashikiensis]GBG13013.1 phosphatidate cytidylyltransferase [Novimethylophilus kurashikiensis]
MLKTRLFTAFFLIGGFLSALFFLPDLYWALVMLVIIALGAWEWGRLTGFSARAQYGFALGAMVVGLALLPDTWPGAWSNIQPHVVHWSMLAATLFWVGVVPAWLFSHHKSSRKPLLAIAGAMVLLPAWLALVYLRKVSPWSVLIVVMVVSIADSAAYFSGKAFGRRKLAPLISPGKTWEGVAGATVAVALFGVILSVGFGFTPWIVAGLLVLMVLSIVGDLFESLLKRQAGLKDSGDVLPGHGGILDRIDGLTSTLPLAAVCLNFPIYYAAFHE